MEPKVSVCMITYNQEKFIAQAIESVLMQETDFPIELVIGEDCSTDGTRAIVEECQRTHPDVIIALCRERNMGARKNSIDVRSRARGEYIALLEGDDYWTDPVKLQKQVDVLDTHPDCAICLHNSHIVQEDGSQPPRIAVVEPKVHLEQADFVNLDYFRDKGGLICRGHTSSVVFRRSALPTSYPDWFYQSASGDIPFMILVSEKGHGHFIDELMSVYRKNDGGMTNSPAHKGIPLMKNRISMLKSVNRHYGYQYDDTVRPIIERFQQNVYAIAMKDSNYREALRAILGSKRRSDQYDMLKKLARKTQRRLIRRWTPSA